MESEKVKEIKKALEERTEHKPINCSHSEYVEACGMYCRHRREFVADMGIKNGQTCENCNKFIATDKVKEYADILTLINELESENERLLKTCKNCHYIKDLEIANGHTKELKTRIAGLEGKLEAKEDYYNAVKDRALEVFAQKIKENLDISVLGYSTEEVVTDIKNTIDETLKECLGK